MKDREILLPLFFTALGVGLIFFGIATIELKIFFSATFIILMILFMISLFNMRILFKKRIDLRIVINKKLSIFFVLVVISCLTLIFAPVNPVSIELEHVYETFILMSPLTLFRLFSTCFLTTFAPGYIMIEYFFGSYNFGNYGKFGLSLALSYAISSVVGTLLIVIDILTPLNYVISLCILIGVFTYLRFRKSNKDEYIYAIRNNNKGSFVSSNLVLLTSVFLVVVVFAAYYVMTIPGPLGGFTRWDVYEYMRIANNFAVSDITWEPYLGFPLFLYIVSRVAIVPMLYVYVALQYYSILIFLSVYVLVKTLLPKDVKARYYAMLLLLMGSIYSIYFMFVMFTNPGILWSYITAPSKYGIIELFGAGAEMLFIFNTYTLTVPLAIFGIVFGYHYLKKAGNNYLNLLLTGLFAGICLYSHNLMEFSILLCTLLLFSFRRGQLKDFSKLLAASAIFILGLEPLYGFFLTKYIFLRISGLQFTTYTLLLISIFFIILDVGIFCLILKDSILRRVNRIKQRLRWLFYGEDKGIRIISFTIISAVIIILGLNYILGRIVVLPNTKVDIYAIMPWWYYVINMMVPLTIITIIPIKTSKYKPLEITVDLILALFILSLLGVFFPTIFWRNIWTNRLLFSLVIPITLAAAVKVSSIEVSSSTSDNKRNKLLSYGRTAFIILILSVSYVTYAHSVEGWGTFPIKTAVSESMSEGVNWVNNYLGTDTIILAPNFEDQTWGNWHEETTYKTLCALVAKPTVMYFSTTPDLIENLDRLFESKAGGIFIFLSRGEGYPSVESIAPYYNVTQIFQNSDVKIYRVETYPAI